MRLEGNFCDHKTLLATIFLCFSPSFLPCINLHKFALFCINLSFKLQILPRLQLIIQAELAQVYSKKLTKTQIYAK